ncbi:hypothetical protein [Pelagicoccus mobilis]|uniref:Uncharacterized protein n=1 Tax=Pelagicoccus mobilis TaxID=415221 RepID=A0A934VK94_9BACT|nr:hypothetical protein [Pelagicoccus mobilis]MBK1876426.1 hypothetical protein [Pelagicoccus mobilis]
MELHTYYSKLGLLRVTWGSKIDLRALKHHFELLKVNTHYARDLKVITSSPVEEIGVPLTKDNMLLVKQWREESLEDYNSITTAFYGLSPIPSAYISYFSEFFDSKKSLLRQFASEKDAMTWLMRDQKVL